MLSTAKGGTALGRCLCAALVGSLAMPLSANVCGAQELGAQLIANLEYGNLAVEGVTSIQRAPGRPNDLFVSSLGGDIMRIDLTDNSVSPFATIPVDLTPPTTGFFGFLGFTFHPDFANNGQLFVHVADDRNADDGVHHRTYIRRYDLGDPLSNAPTLGTPTTILRYDQHRHDHNGGFLGFQPGDPNTLWIASGDGGNMDSDPDPARNGQSVDDLLGSILRIDVSGDDFPEDPNRNYKIPENNPFADGVDGLPEIWNYGIRSPWGGSFDRETGDFFWGDVGQVSREEVNFERFGSEGGRNYGWRTMEGTIYGPFDHDPDELPAFDPSFTPPVHDYEHSGGYGSGDSQQFEGRSVSGGYVYRGPIEQLQGMYVFGDWSSRQVWAMEIDRDANGGLGGVVPGSLIDLTEAFDRPLGGLGGFGSGVTAFGEDATGNLYFSELSGRVFRICEDCQPPPELPMLFVPGPKLRDDFDESHDYQTGTVPEVGIWDGVRNENYGGNGFNADISNSGQLTMGIEDVGWESNGKTDGPMLYREVDAASLLEVRVKISDQTVGQWSSAGIIVRVPGPLGDDENFVTGHSFRVDDEPPGTFLRAQISNVVNGGESEPAGDVNDPKDLTYLRLVSHGEGEFELFSSDTGDDDDWVSRAVAVNPAIADAQETNSPLEVGLWAGSFNGGIPGMAVFDWVEIILGVPAGDYNGDGVVNAADYVVWRNTKGDTVEPYSGADGDGDGVITDNDYLAWLGNYGKVIPDLESASAATIPEPASAAILLSCGVALCLLPSCCRRRRLSFCARFH